MATKKKTKKKSTRSKKSVTRKASSKKPAQKTVAKKKTVSSKVADRKSTMARTRKVKSIGKKSRSESQERRSSAPARASSRLQSGDLQGLSNIESVDSESVDELLEEGNSFEAGVISGVEDSQEREGKEVRTRQVPEDDVPDEYLDEQ
jgi:hypothetical protein